MEEETSKTQVVEPREDQPKPSTAGEALKHSPYLYNRWYKLLLKQ